jgi:hypothetical protein
VRYLESLVAIADGRASKVFLPLEVSGIMSSIGGIAELFKGKSFGDALDAGGGDTPNMGSGTTGEPPSSTGMGGG